jgi:hypothetical protein
VEAVPTQEHGDELRRTRARNLGGVPTQSMGTS